MTFKIAGVQMDVALGEPQQNFDRMVAALDTSVAAGARLTIFPECALTGYCFDSLDEAVPYGQSLPGPATDQMAELCRERKTHVIFGLLEVHTGGLYNACALIGPQGFIAGYRKIHLPYLGIDRFTTPGDRPFQVHDVDELRVGMNIRYDSAFPESARVMALAGADLIALPTNFPPGAECMAEHVVMTRAMENKVFYACVNRVGEERGFSFIGHSKICGTQGRILDQAAHTDEAILYAEIDPAESRTKRIVRVPDKHMIDRFADRRPEMYAGIVEPVRVTTGKS